MAVRPKDSVNISEFNQVVREGDFERALVQRQANKQESDQCSIADVLPLHDASKTVDVCVVGCGPAGLSLSGELAQRGLAVCLVGPETKFTNNYGVWVDEFKDLGLAHLLDHVWDDSVCCFSDREKRINRAYGRLSRKGIRDHLLAACRDAGVTYLPDSVVRIDAQPGGRSCTVHTQRSGAVTARLVNVAGGAASAKFLQFERDAPPVAAQTAYGVEAEVEGYEGVYDPDAMLFMDYRRTHSGMWPGSGRVVRGVNDPDTLCHPNWNGTLGSCGEPPSFLYAMPLGGGRVFLEETCLVARPALPFAALKRRLHRRCEAMGIKIKKVHEEEWSYIPVGGPMPVQTQCVTAFGAAANLVHPATGYSIARTLKEAGPMADAIAGIMARDVSVGEASAAVWEALWPIEKRRQASFHVFGMELLCILDVRSIHEFFETFFALPDHYWRGFLASRLSSSDLLVFALLTFATCTNNIRAALMRHLFDPSFRYLWSMYTVEARAAAVAQLRELQHGDLPSGKKASERS